MITFREYLEFSELEKSVDEGVLSTLSGMVDAGVSGVGTFGKQIMRGAGNVGWGGVKAAANTAGSVFGSAESRKKSRQELGSNLTQITRGLTQAAASPVSALWRGVEAGTNPFSTMRSGDKGGWGEMLGIRRGYEPSWEQLVSKLNSTKDKNERIEIFSQMKNFHPVKYKELENKTKEERERKQRFVSAEPYFISKLPEFLSGEELKKYIEDIYNAHKEGKQLKIVDEKPEVFIKKLMISYINYYEKNQDLDNKLKTILKEYFGHIKIKKLNTPEDLEIDLSKSNINKIAIYINNIYINMKKEDVIILPRNVSDFVKSLNFIRNNIFSNDGFNKNLHKKLESLRSYVDEIIKNYYPKYSSTT